MTDGTEGSWGARGATGARGTWGVRGAGGAGGALRGVDGEVMEIFFLSAVELNVSPLTGEKFLRPLWMEFPPLAAGEILEGDDFIFSSGDEWGMLRLIFALPG